MWWNLSGGTVLFLPSTCTPVFRSYLWDFRYTYKLGHLLSDDSVVMMSKLYSYKSPPFPR